MEPLRDSMSREYITEMYYPEKVTVEEFIRILTRDKVNQSFITNMNNLDSIPQERNVEEWIKTYAAWSEMN